MDTLISCWKLFFAPLSFFLLQISGFPSATATLLIERAQVKSCQSCLDALRAARLAPSQPRAWWALRDAMVAAKRPWAALTALKALYGSTDDLVTRRNAFADARALCVKVENRHSFCEDISV